MKESSFTVGDLLGQLEGLDRNAKLTFEGKLTFSKVKRWADDEFVMEFAEPQADQSEEFKKMTEHMGIKAIFIDPEK